MVEKCGGELLASRLWNELKLAYPIKGHRKGAYWLTYFRLESTRLVEFNRACRLEDDILRHLALKVDPRLVDTLVAHARGEVVRRPTAAVVEVAADDEGEGEVREGT
jgi:small subunit ribosomal protein S6